MPKVLDKGILNERTQHLLKVLMDRYIRDGQPVGSRTLSRDVDLDLSPATIRNIMADLEEMGLIVSPHTSAGRIPTARGYRLFIDTLLQVKPVEKEETQRLRKQLLNSTQDNKELLTQASTLLSEITRLAGVVMLPRRESRALRHVDFLSLSERRVLAILVVNEKDVRNCIIHTSRAYSSSELQQAANYLNMAFSGKEVKAVRDELLKEMRKARESMNRMMQAVIEIADKAFTVEPSAADFLLTGETNLMDVEELCNIDKLRHLFNAFNQKRDILHLLDQALHARGVQIFIGEESGYQGLGECSVVASPYKVNGEVIGVLGVIGPTRMSYDRIIPVVDMTAKLLGLALDHH
ncbi:MAG: heat-inducible transcriptional repressor HrcA [Gammaproteobacteria bacterium]|nr:heat-inducible transcriptional repressor HrcA [Gammaproteobacteria bacterium]